MGLVTWKAQAYWVTSRSPKDFYNLLYNTRKRTIDITINFFIKIEKWEVHNDMYKFGGILGWAWKCGSHG